MKDKAQVGFQVGKNIGRCLPDFRLAGKRIKTCFMILKNSIFNINNGISDEILLNFWSIFYAFFYFPLLCDLSLDIMIFRGVVNIGRKPRLTSEIRAGRP